MKKLVVGFCFAATFILVFYFFYLPYEYQVKFKVKTHPGDVIETIRIWSKSLPESEIVQVDSISSLIQIIKKNDVSYVYNWNFTFQDSLTQGLIKISQPGRENLNKLLVPFTKQQIEFDAESNARLFYKVIKEHLEITKVKIIGEVDLDSSFCLCKRIETSQTDKANAMMHEYPLFNSAIEEAKLKIAGAPSLHVVKWEHSKNSLIYDFCFPLFYTSSNVRVESFQYKEFKKVKALKAIYNGNYITSDRAWYELSHYAYTNGYKIIGGPIEYFIDNPNYGSNDVEWRAEIYLPVSN